jgi:ferredoxin-NADP reductase
VTDATSWQTATVVAIRPETARAKTFRMKLSEPTPHLAGQHYIVRLTAPDGYSAARSYSVASPPDDSGEIELTVEKLEDGEVSSFLHDDVIVGDEIEVRGPIGGWFVWNGDAPAILVGGGSGIVPLMAMIRSRVAAASDAPFRLLYSVRSPDTVWYRDELRALSGAIGVTFVYTRTSPPDWPRPPRRIDATLLAEAGWSSTLSPTCYVCGPTSFVEHLGKLLIDSGHHSERIRTERFGPTGAQR